MGWKIREEFKNVADPYAQQKFFKGDDSQSSSSSSTFDPAQSDYFDKLLGGASDWLDSGGMSEGGSQLDNIGGALGAMGGHYSDVLSGDADRTALDNAKNANWTSAQNNFNNTVIPGLTDNAQQAGMKGSSRSGIAAGLASANMASDVNSKNAQMEYQFQQDAINNKNNAAAGMLNLAGGLQSLQDAEAANSPQARALQSLLAFKDLISGNMGGTTTENSTASGGGGSNTAGILGGLGSMAGGIGTIMSSDKKLKKNIKKVGTAETGGKEVGLYEWDWNDKAKKKGLSGKSEGVLAQEVKKVNPKSVVKDSEGDLAVDYADVKKRKKKKKGAK